MTTVRGIADADLPQALTAAHRRSCEFATNLERLHRRGVDRRLLAALVQSDLADQAAALAAATAFPPRRSWRQRVWRRVRGKGGEDAAAARLASERIANLNEAWRP